MNITETNKHNLNQLYTLTSLRVFPKTVVVNVLTHKGITEVTVSFPNESEYAVSSEDKGQKNTEHYKLANILKEQINDKCTVPLGNYHIVKDYENGELSISCIDSNVTQHLDCWSNEATEFIPEMLLSKKVREEVIEHHKELVREFSKSFYCKPLTEQDGNKEVEDKEVANLEGALAKLQM